MSQHHRVTLAAMLKNEKDLAAVSIISTMIIYATMMIANDI
jgi:hypothetical protein